MTETAASPLLDEADGAAVEVVNPRPDARLVLVCEHAAGRIPARLGTLGLAPADRASHAALDIGARALALALSDRLGAPLVAARFSRLVCDLNRPPEAPSAMPPRVERIEVPGNADLSAAARQARADAIYRPFHDALAETLDTAKPRAMVSIHSFTPLWFGVPRPLNLGVLMHPEAEDLGRAILAAPGVPPMTEANAPYGPSDGVLHTLERHALPRALPNAMIEVRNDLLGDAAGVTAWAEILSGLIGHALNRLGLE